MPVSRKRPLVASNVAPPPKTATTLALERILDGGDAKARHKKKLLQMKRKKQGTLSFQNNTSSSKSSASNNSNRLTNPLSRAKSTTSTTNPFARSTLQTASTNNRWSQIVQKSSQGKGDVKDVFAGRNNNSKGIGGLAGLANVPGFRKTTKTIARKSSTSGGFQKHAKPKKTKSLTTVIRNEDDNAGITSRAVTTKLANHQSSNVHNKRQRLAMSKSPFFSTEPTDSLAAQTRKPPPAAAASKSVSANSLVAAPKSTSSTTKESNFSRLMPSASKPLTGLRLGTNNRYRSNTKDNRRRFVPPPQMDNDDDDDDIEIVNVLPPPPETTQIASPTKDIIISTSNRLNYKEDEYVSDDSDDDDFVQVVKVVQSPEKEPQASTSEQPPKPKPPTKKKKMVLSTASLLKSTEATHRLLSEANDDKKKPIAKPPALPPPAAAPPVYQLRSDVVLAHKEEKETRGKEKQTSSRSSSRNNNNNQKKKVNDNFVRLNMRNNAGSCRGARKKNKRNSKWEHRYNKDKYGKENGDSNKPNSSESRRSTSNGHFYTSRRTGLDPLDDYVDGVFHQKLTAKSSSKDPKKTKKTPEPSTIPKCARHQRPCKLAVVRKNTTGNKGRKFYCCSMPRGEQCNHFEWADDTLEAARAALADNDTSCSGFIGRQVQSYVERFRTLTVPELRAEATKRGLRKTGKKKELLYRLAFWARDEIATSVQEDNVENIPVSVKDDDDDDDDSDRSSSEEDAEASDDELELVEDKKKKKKSSKADDDESSCGSESMDMEFGETTSGTGSKSKEKKLSMYDALSELFGHSGFREGQEWAIQRCLDDKKSLLVAPTGFGKSLCYALPASMLDGVSVVISPLVSLIQDQLRALPPRVPAATLSGSISVAKTAAIIDDIIHKRIKILFVSPERLASPSFQRLFRTKWNPNTNQYERKFPEISLLCIDEAHCVSQWAHNFRPCFLRFQSILATMAPKSILAITATAGPRVIDDICQTIGIHQDKGHPDNKDDSVRVLESGRDNIDVSCHFVANLEERLMMLAKILSPRTKEKQKTSVSTHFGSLAKGSIIVYVWRQKDTEVVAEYLNGSGVEGGVVVYHGGMDAGARSRSQSMFMRGKARICVATVAFGMGIDKADVVGVVHMYLSSSPEHYMQEIGRAGRDGRQAKAIALPMMEEVPRRHSLEHSSIISKSQIRSLLFAIREVVQRSKRSTEEVGNLSLQVALPVRNAVLGCDCKSETIETLLSLIEQSGGSDPLIQVIGFNYDRAFIALKKRSLEKLAEREAVAVSIKKVCQCFNPPIGEEREEAAEAESTDYQVPESFQRQFLAYSLGSYTFSVVDCATVLGPSAEPRHVFAALRRLQSSNELEMSLDTSDGGRVFHLQVSPRGHAVFASHDFDVVASQLTDTLYERFSSSIFSGASKVLDMTYIMNEVGEVCKTSEVLDTGKSTNLVRFQELCEQYLDGKLTKSASDLKDILPSSFSNLAKRDLNADIMTVVQDLPLLAKKVENSSFATVLGESEFLDYSALAVTKFLHGIDSPRVPFLSFRNHALFGKWEGAEFARVQEAVTEYLAPAEEAP